MNRLILLAVLFLASHLTVGTAEATTYYISNIGNNSNVGTDPERPFAFSPGMGGCTSACAAVTLLPGDSVLFNRGDTWRDTLTVGEAGTPGNLITYSTYGSGANPVISGADVISGFADGGSNIWDKTSVTTRPMVAIINGALGTQVASRAACKAPGDWFWAANTLSVYGTSNPSGTVEASLRSYAIDTNNEIYLSINNLILYGANSAGIYVRASSNSVITGVQSKWNKDLGYLIRNQSNTVYNNDDAQANTSIGFQVDANDTNLTFNNCSSSLNFGDGFSLDGITTAAFNGGSANNNGTASNEGNGIDIIQDNGGAPSTNITIANFVSHDNFGNGIDVISILLGDTGNSGIVIAGGKYYNNKNNANLASGIRFDDNTKNSIVEYVQSYGNGSSGIVNEASAHNNAMIYNQVWGNNNGITQSNSAGANNVYYGNVSYGNTTSGYAHESGSPNAATVKNNIFMNNGIYGYITDGGGSPDTVDYNIVYANGVNYQGISKPTHDVNSDPLFLNAATKDFRLGAGSPAIDKGVNLGTPYNLALDPTAIASPGTLDQNSAGTGWDIGAFVYLPNRLAPPTDLTAVPQ